MFKLLLKSIERRRTLKMATVIAAAMVNAATINQEAHDTDVNLGEIARESFKMAKLLNKQSHDQGSN